MNETDSTSDNPLPATPPGGPQAGVDHHPTTKRQNFSKDDNHKILKYDYAVESKIRNYMTRVKVMCDEARYSQIIRKAC